MMKINCMTNRHYFILLKSNVGLFGDTFENINLQTEHGKDHYLLHSSATM